MLNAARGARGEAFSHVSRPAAILKPTLEISSWRRKSGALTLTPHGAAVRPRRAAGVWARCHPAPHDPHPGRSGPAGVHGKVGSIGYLGTR